MQWVDLVVFFMFWGFCVGMELYFCDYLNELIIFYVFFQKLAMSSFELLLFSLFRIIDHHYGLFLVTPM